MWGLDFFIFRAAANMPWPTFKHVVDDPVSIFNEAFGCARVTRRRSRPSVV
jgi:hypothetical protein